MALRSGVLPSTLNLTDTDEAAAELDLIGPTARHVPIEVALSNGFGFGGGDAGIVIKRMPPGETDASVSGG